MNTTNIIHIDDHDRLECRRAIIPNRPEGYPVITIAGPEIGAPMVSIYPTLERLRRLRDVISAYLAEHGDRIDDGPADRIDIMSEPVPIPAEACTGGA